MNKFSEAVERRIMWTAYGNHLSGLSETADLAYIEEQLGNDQSSGTNFELGEDDDPYEHEGWGIAQVYEDMEPMDVLELIQESEDVLRDFARFVLDNS